MGKLAINYSKPVSVIDSKYDGSETDSATLIDMLYAIVIGKEANVDTSSIESKANQVYNNLKNGGAVFGVSWLRNVPMISTGTKQGHISPTTGTPHIARLLYLLCKYYNVCIVTDLPKASEIIENWPIEASGYYGSGAPRWCGRIDSAGGGLSNYNANNQNISFVGTTTVLGLLDGSLDDTVTIDGLTDTLVNWIKNYVDAWKSKFPNTDAYYNDAYTGNENNKITTYYSVVAMWLLTIIDVLYEVGSISDTDLPDYYNWVDNVWISKVKSVDWSADTDYQDHPWEVGIRYLIAQLILKNLSKSSTLDPPSGVTIDDMVNNLNANAETSRHADLFVLYNEKFGIIIKRPIYPKVGDIIYIDAWGGSISITGDGIRLEKSTFGVGDSSKIIEISKNYWKLMR